MGRIFEELPCGCLVSKDGGGAYNPCGVYYSFEMGYNVENFSQKQIDLHRESTHMYFSEKKTVEQIWEELGLTPSLDQKIDELIEAILEMDFNIEVEQRTGRVIGFQGKNGVENAKSIIREILVGE